MTFFTQKSNLFSYAFIWEQAYILNFSETIAVKFHVESPWDGGTEVCSKSLSHMAKMADMPIYEKKKIEIFFGINRPMSLQLGIQHWALDNYHVCSNDDSTLTFDPFTQRSALGSKYICM